MHKTITRLYVLLLDHIIIAIGTIGVEIFTVKNTNHQKQKNTNHTIDVFSNLRVKLN